MTAVHCYLHNVFLRNKAPHKIWYVIRGTLIEEVVVISDNIFEEKKAIITV